MEIAIFAVLFPAKLTLRYSDGLVSGYLTPQPSVLHALYNIQILGPSYFLEQNTLGHRFENHSTQAINDFHLFPAENTARGAHF